MDNPPDGMPTRLWLRLLGCTNLIDGRLRENLRTEFDTTLARFDVLAQIDREPKGPTMSELSRRLMVTKGNITDLMGRLEAEGLVERHRHPTDARVQHVHLTAKGKRMLAKMLPVHGDWLAAMLGDLDPDEQQALYALLGKLRESLRQSTTVNSEDSHG